MPMDQYGSTGEPIEEPMVHNKCHRSLVVRRTMAVWEPIIHKLILLLSISFKLSNTHFTNLYESHWSRDRLTPPLDDPVEHSEKFPWCKQPCLNRCQFLIFLVNLMKRIINTQTIYVFKNDSFLFLGRALIFVFCVNMTNCCKSVSRFNSIV